MPMGVLTISNEGAYAVYYGYGGVQLVLLVRGRANQRRYGLEALD